MKKLIINRLNILGYNLWVYAYNKYIPLSIRYSTRYLELQFLFFRIVYIGRPHSK